jgi:hypothetical protein
VPSSASRPVVRAAPTTAPASAAQPARPPARRQQRRRLRAGRVRARDGAGPVRGGRRDAEQVGGIAYMARETNVTAMHCDSKNECLELRFGRVFKCVYHILYRKEVDLDTVVFSDCRIVGDMCAAKFEKTGCNQRL